ncbi:MAG: site-2 protease family protein [Ignavibacteriales bacterium]|nr:site-2 protease family protein [Ignavibacteriales bacterium]
MDEQFDYTAQDNVKKKSKQNYLLHIGLFAVTFFTTTLAGADWITGFGGPYELAYLQIGLSYSVSILFIIASHEFGHYFAAKFHKVKATLPYFIPFPPLPGFISFGTMGAVIKTKSAVPNKKVMFDIGVAGPIAGFIACLGVLIYGFTNVPGVDYILHIHPNYFDADYGKNALSLEFGDTILFAFLRWLFVDPNSFFPPMSEIYHFPFLCVGWFGLFITSMNMIPIGQLDGGHISYTMFGEKNHYKISVVCFLFLFVSGVLGIVDSMLELGFNIGWSGWFFWAAVLYLVIKLKHPPVMDNEPIDVKRKILGFISFIIFIISFSPNPIVLSI